MPAKALKASGAVRSPASKNLALPVNGLLLITILLLSIGLMMMTSASIEISSSLYSDPLFHLKRQAVFMVLGIGAILITISIPTRIWYSYSFVLLILSYALLVAVLIPGIGKEVNGSLRWIDLGFFNLQPSELAKVFLVLYLATFLERHHNEVQEKWSGFIKPLLVVGVAVALLKFEPDHGTMVILMVTAFSMIFLAGAKLHRFIFIFIICICGLVALALTNPYVLDRALSFLNPFDEKYIFGSGYQLAQSLIAFGRGELFGVGLGNSIQKLYFLPEAHTDFVLAILAEELGLAGVAVVIGLFCLLVCKGLSIGKTAQRKGRLFSAYLAYGISIIFASQILFNVGVNTGLLPTKGLTLPFLSYGGSSLLVSCFMVGMLIRIQYEDEQVKVPGR
ncbi:MAG: putative lipid II flippase FtsW [Gammaproteobacteria bacterium]|nr:putative lipid II flippase FtsW [Gammaproteobacteria bacterium]